MDSVLELERNRATAAHKSQVAPRVTSLKSAISLSMPSGSQRQKEQNYKREHIRSTKESQNPSRNVGEQIEKPKVVEDSDEMMERKRRMDKLRLLYGDASTSDQPN